MRTRRALAAVALLAGVFPASVAAGSSKPLVIHGDTRLASFAVKTDGTLDDAVQAFGEPTRLVRNRVSCRARWATIGLSIWFYNLGGQNPCVRQWGYFSRAVATGRRWQTSLGLKIGAPLRHLWTRHPRAQPRGAWWWIVTRWSPYGDGGPYAGLAAKVRNGRVVAFEVNYAAGGD